ncbi:MAG: amidohydrolase family protein [Candidatus Tectomicrobia bacterium]|uniref:Amidohydrolase family protein n=1 Tax=Tectimicrobiota bacterium TaxID=2528274 RepID=A0A932MMB2_UNCTE|nr:amidohydrolase family protein [Candidatus Tectomicrobia bacterium]
MPEALALTGCEAWTPLERIPDALLLVEGGRFAYVGPRSALPLPPGVRRADLGGAAVCPGFVDLQVNGLGPEAVLGADAEGLLRLARELARRGTTAFLPTATTAPPEDLLRAARAAREAWERQRRGAGRGAAILGLHLEGPYFNPAMRGAHPAEHLRPADLEELERIGEAAGGFGPSGRPGLRLLTLSPEAGGALEAARAMSGRGVAVAMGHTAATEEQVEAFIEAGARFAVHAFNRYGAPGGGPPDHRAPGPMAAAASDPRLMAGLIADGVHVHPGAIASFARARGWERVVLTSDLVSDRGLSGEGASAEGAAVRRGGILSGSRLSLGEMLPNYRRWTGLSPGRAVAAATQQPARLLGLQEEAGRLLPGTPADLCVLDPATLAIRAVMAGGEWVISFAAP